MALVDMKLPQCDCCGAIGLPRPGPARDDPRGKRPDGSGKRNHDRCGTCKGDWDRDYVAPLSIEEKGAEIASFQDRLNKSLELIEVYAETQFEVPIEVECEITIENPRTMMQIENMPKPEICAGARSFSEQLKERVGEMTGATKRRCIHGLIGCTICAKES